MVISRNSKLILNGILIFSILSLSIAYFIQYVLGHKPCNLCLIERIPYIASVILISLLFIINKFEKIIFIIVLFFFIFGALVSFYHFGIEQGFFSESLVCNLKDNANLSKDQLLKQLKESSIVSCKNVTFRVLGFSLATINTVISIIITVIIIKVIKNHEKNK
ncbi:disulfide bond formation protein B [Pelagibacteraceae bacterium]|nr:disulfide bond formation protein B [Pelagibacteraceae bacterium]